MALVLTKKDAGGGWIECTLSSDLTNAPVAGKVDYGVVRINIPAYNALAAAGKADIDAMVLNNVVLAPFT